MDDALVTRISIEGAEKVIQTTQQVIRAYQQFSKLANSNPVSAAAFQAARQQLGLTGTTAAQAAQQFQAAAPKMGIIGTVVTDVREKVQGLRGHLNAFGAEAGKFADYLAAPFHALGGVLPAIGGAVSSFFSSIRGSFKYFALTGGWMAERWLKSNLSMVSSFQQTQIGFKTLLGSESKAKALMAQNQQWANFSPWGINEANDLSQALLIAQVPLDKINKTMNNIGNAVAATGGGADVLSRVAYNFQDIASKQAINAMDIRQFSAAHMSVLPAIAAKLGMSVTQVKALQAGPGGGNALYNKIGGITGLAEALGSQYPNAMLEQSKTILGRISTLKDQWQQGVREGFAPVVPIITDYLAKAAPAVQMASKMFATVAAAIAVRLPAAIDHMKPAMAWVLNALATVIEWAQRNASKITGVFSTIANIFTSTFTLVGAMFKGPVGELVKGFIAPAAIAALTAFASVLQMIANHSKGLSDALMILLPLMIGGTVTQKLKSSKAGSFLEKHAASYVGGTVGALVTGGILGPEAGPLGAWIGQYVGGKIGGNHPAAIFGTIIAGMTAIYMLGRKLYENSKGFRDIWNTIAETVRVVAQPFAALFHLIGPLVSLAFRVLGLLFKVTVWWQIALELRLVGLAFRGIFLIVRAILSPLAQMIQSVRDIAHAIGQWHWPTPPRWLRDILGAPSAVWHKVTDWIGDTGSPVMLGNSAAFHGSMSGRVPGGQYVTSGYRTNMLGSANSDHLRGAYDVAGAGLGAYGAAVRSSGGYAAMHGRHLHVVPPMGDSGSPVGGSGGGRSVSIGNMTFHVYPTGPIDFERSVINIVNRLGRDNIERSYSTINYGGV